MELWMLRCSLLGLSLLYSSTAAEPGLDLRCTNDCVRHMFCGFGRGSERPDPSDCRQYKLHTEVKGSMRNTERNCSFSPDPRDRSGTCGCSVKVSIIPGEEHTTTLWRAGHLTPVITKIIPVRENILPRAPFDISVDGMSNGSYIVTWDNNYTTPKPSCLMHTVIYQRRGEKGTEAVKKNTSITWYEILAEDLESSTEYLVNVKSYCSYYSESTETKQFTTRSFDVTVDGTLVHSKLGTGKGYPNTSELVKKIKEMK